ncbi:MAG: hypothetical protein K6U80_00190 [Firmicutes bacterium]|nr:hypothetical protein [Bacillota bacterium]
MKGPSGGEAFCVRRPAIPGEMVYPLRLALLSPFPEKYREASGRTAQIRNLMVAALAERVLWFFTPRRAERRDLE